MTELKGPHEDSDADAIHVQVGRCLAMWSHVEHALQSLFSALMGGHFHKSTRAFIAVISFEARLAMVNALIEQDKDDELRKSWNAIFNKLTTLYRRRHQVAHFTLVVYPGDGYKLHPFFALGKESTVKPLSCNDLRVRELLSAVRTCASLICICMRFTV